MSILGNVRPASSLTHTLRTAAVARHTFGAIRQCCNGEAACGSAIFSHPTEAPQ